MPYQPIHFYQLLPAQTYSVFSRPRRAPQAPYEIHFVKSTDPHYIPDDLEAWPLYHRCLLNFLAEYRDIFDKAVKAVEVLRQKLKGLENRDIAPGTGPAIC